MAKQFIVSEALLNQLLQYLAGRPYIEVFRLVAALQDLKGLPPEEYVVDQDQSITLVAEE